MKVAILCDGGNEIGAGHFFRCLAISRELEKLLVEVIFIFPSSELEQFAKAAGIKYEIVNELFDSSSSIEHLLCWVPEMKIDRILIDSHRATKGLLSTLKGHFRIIYIDDSLSFPYPADIVVNTHVDFSERDYINLYRGTDVERPLTLIGEKFVTISGKNREDLKASAINNNVLFLAGGSDPSHATLKFLEYLCSSDVATIFNFQIVVGLMNQDWESIKKYGSRLSNISFFYGLTDLSILYAQCQIAISAAGVTLYELAYYGVPAISYSLVDNQVHTSIAFDKLGICIDAGDIRNSGTIPCIIKKLKTIISNPLLLNQMRENGQNLIDGQGAHRIAKAIIHIQ